jgi:hypothetical protein
LLERFQDPGFEPLYAAKCNWLVQIWPRIRTAAEWGCKRFAAYPVGTRPDILPPAAAPKAGQGEESHQILRFPSRFAETSVAKAIPVL